MSKQDVTLIQATVASQAAEAARTAGVPISEVHTYASADMWSILFPCWSAVMSQLHPVEDEGLYAVSFVRIEV